jgi:predicted O-methyltransferase YrrM
MSKQYEVILMFPNWFKDVEKYFRHVPTTELRALQVGAYTGDATLWLLNNRNVITLHDVDTWGGSQEKAHETLDFTSVEEFYDSRTSDIRVVKCKMTSDEFFNLNDKTFNFIYIDGDHTALQTALDGLNAFKVLESGGVMAFDDYLWNYDGNPFNEPKRGVDAFLAVCQGQYTLIESGYQVWIRKC